MKNSLRYCFLIMLFCLMNVASAEPLLKALLIEGQNNHRVWPTTSKMMKQYLEDTGLFDVEIVTTKQTGTDPDFTPTFSDYDVVVSNYNGSPWPESTQHNFEQYVKNGGGFVVVHAANNAFANWDEYNKMIGLGGWGGRNEKSGPYVFFDDNNALIKDTSPGRGGHHGPQHPFTIRIRKPDHPITKGMPSEWLHANDELYDFLRGPGKNMTVLATAYADKEKGGSGRHEPMIFTIDYGKGRVFHTPMGHGVDSQECVGFIVTLQRGAQWAATGKVTQKLPEDFPTAEKVRSRKSRFAPPPPKKKRAEKSGSK